jgi:hypothetical protein
VTVENKIGKISFPIKWVKRTGSYTK